MDFEAGKLEQVLDFLDANPEVHNQREWVCGTVACIAGWTVALFDHELTAGKNLRDYMSECGISERAVEILGLSYAQERGLFNECSETAALSLGRAMIAQSKGDELSVGQRFMLASYNMLNRSEEGV